ncbi:MAG: hypothetical protein WCO55_01465 [Candidatus Falkowbacteria bacterium]
MDKLAKALRSFSLKERKQIKFILLKIKNNSLVGLDLMKLKNNDNIFRIRKGKLRIIYRKLDDGKFSILAIERRTDNTYNNY